MFKRSLSRNQRSKGSRVKHAFQVCLLVAVCVWLLYQVKHSHDKKKAIKERSSGLSSILEESNAEVLRFGRKDLPHVVETGEKTVTLKDDEINEDAEEAESEPEHLTEENVGKDDARVAGEDGIDRNDREEADEDGENGEELESEEEKDAEKDNHLNEARLLNNQEEDPKADTQEAREEQYRAVDASSAVVRHGEMMTESEGMSSNEEEQMDTVERDAKIDDSAAGTEEDLYEVNQFNASLEQEDIHLVNNSSTIETSLRLPEHESDSLTKSTTFQSSNQLEQQHNSTLDVVNGNIPLRYSTAISNLVHNLNSTKGREVTGEDDDSNSADDSDSDRERDLIEEKEKSDMTDRTEDEDSNSAEGDFERERDLIEEKEKSDTTDRAEDEDSNPAEEGDLEREKDLIEEKEKSYIIDRDEDEDQNVDPLVSDDTSAKIGTVMDDERDAGTESKNEDVAAE